jgi:hypothetical protein
MMEPDVFAAYESLSHDGKDALLSRKPGKLYAHLLHEADVLERLGLLERVEGPSRFAGAHGIRRLSPLGEQVRHYARTLRALERTTP